MMQCECLIHRYHVAHICEAKQRIIPHSQASLDEHKTACGCKMTSFAPAIFQHNPETTIPQIKEEQQRRREYLNLSKSAGLT